MNEEITTRLNSIFREVFKDQGIEVFEGMTTDDVEKWDSLSHLTLIATVEESFNIKFRLKELVAMKNVGDLLQRINEKVIA